MKFTKILKKEKKEDKRIKKRHEVDKDSWGKEMPTRRPFFTWRNINACVLFVNLSLSSLSRSLSTCSYLRFFPVLFSSTESSLDQKYKTNLEIYNHRINFILLNLRNIRKIFVLTNTWPHILSFWFVKKKMKMLTAGSHINRALLFQTWLKISSDFLLIFQIYHSSPLFLLLSHRLLSFCFFLTNCSIC